MTRSPACAPLSRRPRRHCRPGCRPFAVGLFGYLGYDMVRLMEKLPALKPDVLGVPDAVLVRPTLIAVFDHVRDALSLFTTVWPQAGMEPQAAWDAAQARLDEAEAALDRPAPRRPRRLACRRWRSRRSNFTREGFIAAVERQRNTSRAGDASRWCPASGFRCPSPCRPSRSTGRCAHQPGALPVLLDFGASPDRRLAGNPGPAAGW